MCTSSPSQFSSSPPSSTTLSEHKPVPAAQSKVHDLARRYSAMAKSSGGGADALGLPQESRPRGGSFGRTEGTKVLGLLGKYTESTSAATVSSISSQNLAVGRLAPRDLGEEVRSSTKDEQEEAKASVHRQASPETTEREDATTVENEKEIETTLRISALEDGLRDVDLVDIPLSNGHTDITAEVKEEVETETSVVEKTTSSEILQDRETSGGSQLQQQQQEVEVEASN
ncbi:hypothetical protein BGZ83_011607 [Gryganskiella cystojenkinii]|nr:hypothetical protein BGZ83_011607 [Gryganskiella cystojenkinii]